MSNLTLYANHDSSVYDLLPTTNYGTSMTLYVDIIGSEIWRSFIRWDVSSIPSGAIIITAHIALSVNLNNYSGTIDCHKVTGTQWYESSITWNNQPAAATLIGSYANTGSSGYKTIVSGANVISAVQDWLDTPANSKGIRLKAQNESGSDFNETYDSSEDTDDPKLVVHYNRQPNTPDQLSPTGGAAVDTATPTISGRYTDADTEDTCDMIQIKIYESDGVTQKYDTGQVAPTGSPVAHNGTWSYTIPGAANLEWGQTYKYKVRVRDHHNASNSWSDYTALQSFVLQNNPVVSAISPGSGDTVYTNNPTITWNFYQAQGLPQKAYRVRIDDDSDPSTSPIYDSGWVYSSDASHTCPIGTLPADDSYWVRVDVLCTNDLEDDETAGSWTYSSIAEPTGLTLTPDYTTGSVLIEWTDGASCDECEIYYRKSGETAWELVGTVGDGVEEFTDYSGAYGVIEYAVVNVDTNGYKSNPADCYGQCTHTFENWWIANNDDSDLLLELWGVSEAPYTELDNKVVWHPLGRTAALVEEGAGMGRSSRGGLRGVVGPG